MTLLDLTYSTFNFRVFSVDLDSSSLKIIEKNCSGQKVDFFHDFFCKKLFRRPKVAWQYNDKGKFIWGHLGK